MLAQLQRFSAILFPQLGVAPDKGTLCVALTHGLVSGKWASLD